MKLNQLREAAILVERLDNMKASHSIFSELNFAEFQRLQLVFRRSEMAILFQSAEEFEIFKSAILSIYAQREQRVVELLTQIGIEDLSNAINEGS